MNKTIRKIISLILTVSVGFALTGCGSVITDTITGNDSEQEVEELPFEVAEDSTDMSVGQIGKYDENLYCGLACVRVMDNVESEYTRQQLRNYNYEIPAVFDDQEVIYPLIHVYNNSDELQFIGNSHISLYADSMQIEATEPEFVVFVDGIEIRKSNPIDSGETALMTSPFIVDKGWTEIKVFCESLSWTITPDDVKTDPYTYESMFSSAISNEFNQPGDVIYSDLLEVTYDGCEIKSINSRQYIVFEFTVNNRTNDTLEYRVGGTDFYINSRAYSNSRLLPGANHFMDDVISGYSNLYDSNVYWHSLEVHSGMTSRFYIAFETMNSDGVFECYFDPEFHDDGEYTYMQLGGLELAHVCVEVQG